MRVLDFKEGSLVPTEPGDYMVVVDPCRFLHCKAAFQEGDFIGFMPTDGADYQLLQQRHVLAHAKLPPAREILRQLYPEVAACLEPARPRLAAAN